MEGGLEIRHVFADSIVFMDLLVNLADGGHFGYFCGPNKYTIPKLGLV